jgi:NitT/TauT family transport system substrate-binding protein
VNSEVYQDWEDLDGQEIAVHSRGSGTEALMKMMAEQKGIEYADISYVPGSEVRAGAMLQGTIDATIVDAANFRLLQEEGGDKFKRLPIEGVDATDEALYATAETLDERADDIAVFVDALLETWAEIDANPEIVGELREAYGLLPDLPEAVAGEAVPYYREAVENDIYPLDGGSPEVVRGDLAFLASAGDLDVDPEAADPSDFWDFGPLEAARAD